MVVTHYIESEVVFPLHSNLVIIDPEDLFFSHKRPVSLKSVHYLTPWYFCVSGYYRIRTLITENQFIIQNRKL